MDTAKYLLRNNFMLIKSIFVRFLTKKTNFWSSTCHFNTIFSHFINLWKFLLNELHNKSSLTELLKKIMAQWRMKLSTEKERSDYYWQIQNPKFGKNNHETWQLLTNRKKSKLNYFILVFYNFWWRLS